MKFKNIRHCILIENKRIIQMFIFVGDDFKKRFNFKSSQGRIY
jgi:hypothetical protein